ncbi:MAG: ATP-binding protein [Clostridiaceae bacterium]|nr:ATP-binding protein [Clostridiaceae bacterium]
MEKQYIEQLNKIRNIPFKIIIYKNVLKDPIVCHYFQIEDEFFKDAPSHSKLTEIYYNFISSLYHRYGSDAKACGDLWEHHLLNLIATDENIFSLACERGEFSNIPFPIIDAAAHDLRLLHGIVKAGHTFIYKSLKQIIPLSYKPCLTFSNSSKQTGYLKNIFLKCDEWHKLTGMIAAYYVKNGCGIFNKFKVLRWTKEGHSGFLSGINNPDPIRLHNLVGYERERYDVVQNTLQFIHGFPANNVLLYGDRGTGKSSTVKAILNEYESRGLRLIEVSKKDLNDLPTILELLRNRGLKFIIFIDDLSFESDETQYRELKSILEGSVEARPSNVLIYATSNRRHLIKEYFYERSTSDEIGSQDTLQEKLSLSDRFGISVTFLSPDQEKYLYIVEQLAKQRNLEIDSSKLKNMALQWEMWHNGRTPRAAKQFIDHLEGKIKLDKNLQKE